MGWLTVGDGLTMGSEGGVVLADEEDDAGGARITLERGASLAPFAITCGVYGWMVHTRFFGGGDDARAAYEAMKPELEGLVALVPMNADPEKAAKIDILVAAIRAFVDKYPT